MKKKVLVEELLKNGYVDKDGSYLRTIYDSKVEILIESGFLGSIKNLTIVYEFRTDLEEDYMEDFLQTAETIIKNATPNLAVEIVGIDFIEVKIKGRAKKKLSADVITKECEILIHSLQPLFRELFL